MHAMHVPTTGNAFGAWSVDATHHLEVTFDHLFIERISTPPFYQIRAIKGNCSGITTFPLAHCMELCHLSCVNVPSQIVHY